MSLGSDLLAQLPYLRAEAESRMTDTCTIYTAGAGRVWNDETLSYDDDEGVAIYSGPCRVKRGNTQAASEDAAGQPLTTQSLEVHLPVLTSSLVGVNDIVQITNAPHDPALLGRRFRITSSPAHSQATARRLPVEETS